MNLLRQGSKFLDVDGNELNEGDTVQFISMVPERGAKPLGKIVDIREQEVGGRSPGVLVKFYNSEYGDDAKLFSDRDSKLRLKKFSGRETTDEVVKEE